MDKLFIKELEIETTIGVYAWEQAIKQRITLDIETLTDASLASQNDDIQKTVDYSAMTSFVCEYAISSQCKLIETFADRLAAALLQNFQLPWIKITLYKKGALKQTSCVGITIERST